MRKLKAVEFRRGQFYLDDKLITPERTKLGLLTINYDRDWNDMRELAGEGTLPKTIQGRLDWDAPGWANGYSLGKCEYAKSHDKVYPIIYLRIGEEDNPKHL